MTAEIATPNNTAEKNTVLLAEDEPLSRELLRVQLQQCGVAVDEAEDGKEAMQKMRSHDYAAAFFDLDMPGANGIQCLEYARRCHPDLSVVIVSAVGEINDAVESMKLGAEDYLVKPCDRDSIAAVLRRAVSATRLARENKDLREAIDSPPLLLPFVAESENTRELLEYVERVSDLESTVLLTGPSGTGKSFLARRIHELSNRRDSPFVVVNCASLPRDLVESELFGHVRGAFTGATNNRPGRAEMADGGTLFLDEIGDMPLELQPKLLTFLQDRVCQRIGSNETRQVDARVIAATNKDLMALCQERLFREDLFFRLEVISFDVPPLVKRRDDILPLSSAILERIAARRREPPYQINDEAMDALMAADWPGNVRQLENCLERATAFCTSGVVTKRDLTRLQRRSSDVVPEPPPQAQRTLQEAEIQAIRDTLQATGGNRSETARRLGVSEKTIYNKINKYGITNNL